MLKNVIVCFVKDSISNSYKFLFFFFFQRVVPLKPTPHFFKTKRAFLGEKRRIG